MQIHKEPKRAMVFNLFLCYFVQLILKKRRNVSILYVPKPIDVLLTDRGKIEFAF